MVLDSQLIAKKFSLSSGADVLFPEINMTLRAGECLGLLGAGGTGRSLFLRSLAGLARGRTTRGELKLDGSDLTKLSSSKALRSGVFYQSSEPIHFSGLSLWENLFLSELPKGKTLWSHHKMKSLAKALLAKIPGELSIDKVTSDLTESELFWLSWARFYLNPRKLLLIDESSSGLQSDDAERFRAELQKFKTSGGMIIYALPGLTQDEQVCDRFLFLSKEKSEIQQRHDEDLSQKIRVELPQSIEENEGDFPPKNPPRDSQPLIRFENFHYATRSRDLFKDVHFELKKGEILGLFGSQTSGRGELLFSFFGAMKKLRRSGVIHFPEGPFYPEGPAKAVAKGMAYVSGFRTRHGLFKNMSVGANLALPHSVKTSFLIPISAKRELKTLTHFKNILRLDRVSLKDPLSRLDNNEQQKLMLGRWLSLGPRIYFLDEPLRGLTQRGRSELAYLIRQLSDEGISFVIGSSDFLEQFSLCHRMLVMKEGQILGELTSDEMNRNALYKLAVPKNRNASI